MCLAVAICQGSQTVFDFFDKAIIFNEGRETSFGPVEVAMQYFERMRCYSPSRQTTGDFLTSVITSPREEGSSLWRSLKVECGVFQEGTKFDAALGYDG